MHNGHSNEGDESLESLLKHKPLRLRLLRELQSERLRPFSEALPERPAGN